MLGCDLSIILWSPFPLNFLCCFDLSIFLTFPQDLTIVILTFQSNKRCFCPVPSSAYLFCKCLSCLQLWLWCLPCVQHRRCSVMITELPATHGPCDLLGGMLLQTLVFLLVEYERRCGNNFTSVTKIPRGCRKTVDGERLNSRC